MSETPSFDDLVAKRGGKGGTVPEFDSIVDPPSKAHPGFSNVAKSIAAKQGVSRERAGAILGAATRRASASAKRANPRLKRVKG